MDKEQTYQIIELLKQIKRHTTILLYVTGLVLGFVLKEMIFDLGKKTALWRSPSQCFSCQPESETLGLEH